ncbi:TIGR03435 family protein [Granulicella tundricola]|uniref:Soil-associated protein, TIGR03435 family n=1 Tax=Granulicella tundricola (strain ATCC BAA-1859 / DSM 23138 / MP5ACTX9) TaxID=1198114 RepID=E8WZL8_GRATM|nr:TIGR03435 family protein [Granulicella tundricola]ADW69992.1 hypothetical protein AciX9_2969 [Granulicella tundricola MP5ACTX9]
MRNIILTLVLLAPLAARAQTFAVASIRPTTIPVEFERDGSTKLTPGALHMRDVTVSTCIKWAYGVQRSQVSGPPWIESDHFDIEARSDAPATEAQTRLMMRALLADRFKLTFHQEKKELRGFALLPAKNGTKLHPVAVEEESFRQNSVNGMTARSLTMHDFTDFIAGVLEKPTVDQSGLPGKYDFKIDFTHYVPTEENGERPDAAAVINATLQGELGLKIEPQKVTVDVMVLDHVQPPSPN